jgi:translation initiation factor 3 subunit C
MASKFFADAGNSASSEEEDNRSEQSEEDKQVAKRPLYMESSSDEEEKRVVRTEKDKRYEAIKSVITRIKDKIKIKDFITLNDEFDELNKQLEKSKKVIEKEGVPMFYIRICHDLDAFCQNFPADEKKALKPANNKAYNTLKHKMKKNNKNYEQKLKEFAANPVYSDEEESDEEKITKKKETKTKKEADDDDDYWLDGADAGGESDGESEDEEEDIKKYLQSNDPQVRRNYWLKRDDGKDKDEEEKEKKEEDKKRKEQRAKDAKKRVIDESKFNATTKKRQLVHLDEMDKTIKEIVERRSGRKTAGKEGKKLTVEDDLDVLVDFLEQAKGDELKRLEVILILMPTRMDFAKNQSQYYMPRDLWLQNFENLAEYFRILRHQYKKLSEVRTFQRDENSFYTEEAVIESFSTHFEGLDNELWKAFKAIESSSMEYSERLKDHSSMVKLINDCINFFKGVNDETHETKFSYKKIEYTYFISDKLCRKLSNAASERAIDTKNEFYTETNSEKVMSELANRIYKSGDNKTIIKTMLYHIYHHAINGRFHIAKEYLLMSHIADASATLDVNTQISYNRVLVQLGLSAFSLGLIQETVNALTEIVSSLRIRELLGQGISKNSLNEKEERRRLLPTHLHINAELVEAVHLIASMLIEIPNIVADPNEANKKQSAKYFRRQYEGYKNFYGPPESYKDFIIVAAKELHQGNWKKCYDFLLSVNIWGRLSQDVQQAQTNLLAKVKEQAFKCYLFTFQNCYDTIDIDQLAAKFDITKDYVHAFVSKMVFNKELKAFLDVDSNCLMFERDDLTRVESLSLGLADKVSNMLVNNEKIMDSKYGNYGFSDKDISEGIVKRKTQNKKKLNIFTKDKRKGKGRN